MPAIRDWNFTYGTTTTATTIAATLPNYAAGDLLIAILSTDTGTTQAWTSTGWTQLFSVSNTNNLAVMWKIAGASETAPTFTYTISETANCHIVSIRDVNTTTPFNGTGGAGTGYRTATNSAAVAAMPQLTTTVADSLILYLTSEAGAAVSGVLVGPCTYEDATDGSAHSDGFSWGIQRAVGATPTTVKSTKSGIAAGVLATIGISPPSGGATVIPAYCAADASIYVDPIHGITAYNGNTAFAATATTNFGTTLNGKTLANGTVAAAADVGINPFHSMGQVTGTATAGTWSGGALVLATANKPNATGKNIIAHVKPSTPKVYQNTNTLATTGVKGVAFGMASTAASAYKWWHVHGAGTTWDSAQHVPIVINSANTTGVIQTTGTLNPASVLAFGFAVSGFLVAPVFQFGSVWVLDTTTIAGGNAAEPVGIAGINKVCSTGKERMSVLQQGTSQMLLLQPIQFGDGGTNRTYLKLDNTAIEIPGFYNIATQQVFYNSADNVAGVTYYAGNLDTIIHTNSVISSPNYFHWKIAVGSSPSAGWDFQGLSVIGAGLVQLISSINLDGITFSKCATIDSAGAYLTNCVFNATQGANALTVTSVVNMGRIGFGSVTNNARGIKLSVAGTYTFNGTKFSGNTYDIENASAGAITINCINGSNPVTVINTGGGSTSIVALKTLTLTGIKTAGPNLATASEVRIYAHGTTTEVGGTESCTSGEFAYAYPYTPDVYVDIVVFHEEYLYYRIDNYLLGDVDTSLPIAQTLDRQYFNPTVLSFSLTGVTALNNNAIATYSVPALAGGTYAWSVPSGVATILTGVGTNSITVRSTTNGAFTLSCTATAANGNAGTATKEVTVSALALTVAITGSASMTNGNAEDYAVTPVDEGVYTWSIPSGTATIQSGQGTSSVSVISTTNGNFTVQCSIVAPSGSGTDTQVVAVASIPLTVVITGNTTGTTGVATTFNATVNPGATYTWEIISGTATISSGQGSSSITVTSSTVGSYTVQCTEHLAGYSDGVDTHSCTLSAPVASFISATKIQGNSVATLTTPAFAVQTGDLVIVTACNDTMTVGVSTWTSSGITFTEVTGSPYASYDSTHGTANLKVYIGLATSNNAAQTVQATFSGNVAYGTVTATVIRGVVQNINTVIDQKAYITPYTAKASPSNALSIIATTNASDLIWTIWQQDMTSGANTIADNGNGFTKDTNSYVDTYNSGAATAIFYKSVSTTGIQSQTITHALTTAYAACMIAFKSG